MIINHNCCIKFVPLVILMNKLPEDLQHCFQQWKIRMEQCRDRGGEYIEGDNISIM